MEMTKNEYKAYMKELANKVYTDSNYSMKKYEADLNAVTVLPFNLWNFPKLSANTIKWLNVFFDEQLTDLEGNFMLSGFDPSGFAISKFDLSYGAYSEGLSYWGANSEEMIIFEYVEGDIYMKIFTSPTKYRAEYDKMVAFYKDIHGGNETTESEPPNEPPKELVDIAKAIKKRFVINGSADEGYITNVIAYENGLGDGESHFNGETEIKRAKETAIYLQNAYGCNIAKDEIEELENIIITGQINPATTITGLQRYIQKLKKERRTCDEWRKDYLKKCINKAIDTIREVRNGLSA